MTLTLIAFPSSAIPAFLLTTLIGKHLEELSLMAFSLIAGGFIMWLVDAVLGTRGRTRDVEELSLWQAIWIGLCQTLAALFPGTSRSMSTIAAGEIAGLSRATALEFSFLVSMPTIVVATLYELYKSIRYPESDALGALHLDVHEMIVLAIGFAMSFLRSALPCRSWSPGVSSLGS